MPVSSGPGQHHNWLIWRAKTLSDSPRSFPNSSAALYLSLTVTPETPLASPTPTAKGVFKREGTPLSSFPDMLGACLHMLLGLPCPQAGPCPELIFTLLQQHASSEGQRPQLPVHIPPRAPTPLEARFPVPSIPAPLSLCHLRNCTGYLQGPYS